MLTQEQIKVFRAGGFTEFEIGVINENLRTRPQEIDPESEAWQQVFKNRLNFIRSKLNQGMPLGAIHDRIISFLSRQKGTPWDFLREAYPLKGSKRSDFNKRIEARAKVKDHFGAAYK